MFAAVFESGATPLLPFSESVSFVIHQVIQPWHPQGTYVHEAALAVKALESSAYLRFISAVYKAFDEGRFKDADTWNKSRAQVSAAPVQTVLRAV